MERIYVIPLREKVRVVPRHKKTQKAVKTIKEFLVKHMKIYDRDLRKVKIDNYLNEFLWARGIKNPPHKIKVKATKDTNGIVSVELVDYSEKLKFKKAREEKLEKTAEDFAKKKKEKKSEEVKPEEVKTQEEKKEETEKKKEEEEKKAAVVEAGKEMEKAQAKQMKRQTKVKSKEPKHQFRQALQK